MDPARGVATPDAPDAALRAIPSGPPARGRIGLESVLYSLLLLVLVVTVFLPFVLLLISSFRAGGLSVGSTWSLDGWRTALDAGVTGATLWNTVALAVVRTAISLPIAIFLAWLLARTDLPGGHWLELLFWIAFFLPALPVLQGWVLLLDPEYGLVLQPHFKVFEASPAPPVVAAFGPRLMAPPPAGPVEVVLCRPERTPPQPPEQAPDFGHG